MRIKRGVTSGIMAVSGAFMLAAGSQAALADDADQKQTPAQQLEQLTKQAINDELNYHEIEQIDALVKANPDQAEQAIRDMARILGNADGLRGWSSAIEEMANIGAAHPEQTDLVYHLMADPFAELKDKIQSENASVRRSAINLMANTVEHMPNFAGDAVQALVPLYATSGGEDMEGTREDLRQALVGIAEINEKTASGIVDALEPYLHKQDTGIVSFAAYTIATIGARYDAAGAHALDLLKPIVLDNPQFFADPHGYAHDDLPDIMEGIGFIGADRPTLQDRALKMLADFVGKNLPGDDMHDYADKAIYQITEIGRRSEAAGAQAVPYLKQIAQNENWTLAAGLAIAEINRYTNAFAADARAVLTPLTEGADKNKALNAALALGKMIQDEADATQALNIYMGMARRDSALIQDSDLQRIIIGLRDQYPQEAVLAQQILQLGATRPPAPKQP